jgi:hypothetical protein
MFRPNRASRWLAALLLVVSSHAASAGSVSLSEIVAALEIWLDENSTLPRRAHPPEVRLVPAAFAKNQYGSAGFMGGHLRAYYDGETETVTLVAPWNPKSLADRSILLHELVHHRQKPFHAYCDGAKELPAYKLQAAWAEPLGIDLDINWMAAVLESGCTPRDFHPD